MELVAKIRENKFVKPLIQLINNYRKSEEPHKLDWLTFGLIAIVLFFMVVEYGDFTATLRHGVLFDEALFKGRIFDYYQFVLENSDYTQVPVVWEIPMVAIVGIFMLPIYIVKILINVDLFDLSIGILYGKIFLVIFTYFCAKTIKNIILDITQDKNLGKWIFFIFFTSTQIYLHIFGIGRFDIIPTFAMLKMIECALNKKTVRFILWAALGITLKSFALFLFIPMILFYEKSLLKIIGKTICALLGLAACILWYHNDPAYIASGASFRKAILSNLFASHTVHIYIGMASLVVVSMIIVCCFAYVINPSNNKTYNLKIVSYIGFTVFISMFLFMGFHPNWIVTLVPFSILIMFTSPKYFKLNIILDIFLYMVLVFSFLFIQSGSYGANILNILFHNKIISFSTNNNYISIFELLGIENSQIISSILMGLFLGISLVILIINFPRQDETSDFLINTNDIIKNKGLLYVRTIAILTYLILLVLPAHIEKPQYDLLFDGSLNAAKCEQSIAGNTKFEQTFYVPYDIKINKIGLNIVSDHVQYPQYDTATFNFEIIDENNNKIYQKQINNTSFENLNYEGGNVLFDVHKVCFENAKTYKLVLSSINTNFNKTWAPLVANNIFNDDNFYMTINGQKSDKVLAMRIYGESSIAEEDLDSQIIGESIIRNENNEILLTVKMKNTGKASWSELNRIHLGYGINGVDHNEIRGTLPLGKLIKSSECYTYTVNMGNLSDKDVIAFQMVEEGVLWFGDRAEFKVGDLFNKK